MQDVHEDEERVVAEDKNWDSDAGHQDFKWRPVEIPMFRLMGASAKVAANAPLSRLPRSAQRKACQYNPNRHFERDDYVATRASLPSIDKAGPP